MADENKEIQQPVAAPIQDVSESSIYDRLFGEMDDLQTQYETAKNNDRVLYQNLLNAYKQNLEQGRTDAVKMAKYNALGNALTTMVQPLGWTAGGATGGVQAYDNRQYLDAFNRAVKADEDIRNVGLMDMKYQLDFANRETEEAKDRLDARRSAELNEMNKKMAHEYRMEEIESRADFQKDLAEAKAKYKILYGRQAVSDSVAESALKQALRAYYNYKNKVEIINAANPENKQTPMTFDEFVGNDLGELGFNVQSVTKSSQDARDPNKPAFVIKSEETLER